MRRNAASSSARRVSATERPGTASVLVALLAAAAAAPSRGQSSPPTMAIDAATIQVGRGATDGYSLHGSFGGLSFDGPDSVIFAVGQFAAAIPIAAFTRSPGSGVLSYQDATGSSPYWASSLTIDLDARTFSAKASDIALAGLANPFAVRLGAGPAIACAMARVASGGGGAYQLSAGDGDEPCGVPAAIATPPAVVAGAATAVTFALTLPAGVAVDAGSLRLFRADANAQPVGDALCALAGSGAGPYGCAVTFDEAAPGFVPLLVQASAGASRLLSPGFSVQVAGPESAANLQQLKDIGDAITQAQENFERFGDGVHARVATLAALRQLLGAPPGLTGQAVALAPDGLSIGVRSDAGLTIVDQLDDGFLATSAIRRHLEAGGGTIGAAAVTRAVAAAGPGRVAGRAAATGYSAPQCGDFARTIVQNDRVLVWDPARLFLPLSDPTATILQVLQGAQCPRFQVDERYGNRADLVSIGSFPQYGTIIITTHGGVDINGRTFLDTGERSSLGQDYAGTPLTEEGVSCFSYGLPAMPKPFGCFKTIYNNSFRIQILDRTIIWAGACYGSQFDLPPYAPYTDPGSSFQQALAPEGSNSVYFGFSQPTGVDVDALTGATLFNSLIHQFTNTADAWEAAVTAAPDARLGESSALNLAYLGNPTLAPTTAAGDSGYTIAAGSAIGLQARLDGAQGCSLQYRWTNTARAGHLSSPATGEQDNFTDFDPSATYIGNANAGGVDDVSVEVFPSLDDPAAAKACASVHVAPPTPSLHVVFDGSGTSSLDFVLAGLTETATLSWHAAWDIAGDLSGAPGGGSGWNALPGTTVTGESNVITAAGELAGCPGGVVINTRHGSGPPPALPQSPYLGSVGPTAGSPRVFAMWVDTFGGDDYHLCDGGALAGVGDYGPPEPGYPAWDTRPEYAKFNLDLGALSGGPDQELVIKVGQGANDPANQNGVFTTVKNDAGDGMVTWGGTITITKNPLPTPPPGADPPGGAR